MARLDLGKVVPQKGVDYYTEQDKEAFATEVESDVLDNLKDIDNLTYYTLAVDTGSTIELSINSSTYVVTLNLKNSDGTTISTGTIDLPLESVVVNGSYDSATKKVILTLQNGSTIEFSVADLVSGLQSEITSENKLSSDLVDDTNQTNKFVTTNEKNTWNGKYDKPASGIPSTDMSSTVQESLGKANSSTQQYSTMPEASVDYLGKIVQYVGTTTNDYTNGYFYVCITDGEETPTYSWENIKVQEDNQETIIILNSNDDTNTRKEKGQKIIDYYLDKGYLPTMYYKEFIGSNFNLYDVHCNSEIRNTWSSNSAKFSVWYFATESNEYYGTPTFFYKGTFSISFNNDYVVSGMSYNYISNNNYGRSFKPLASYGTIVGGNSVYGIDGYKKQCSALSVANTTEYTPTSNYHPATKKYVDDTVANSIGDISTILETLVTVEESE